MTALDRQYRKTSLGLGFALLLMFLLLQGCMTALAFANRLLAPYLAPDLLSGLYWGLYCLAYLFCFLMPIPFYRLILRKHVQQPVFYELRLPPMFLLLAVAALGIITAAGYLNSLLVLPFGVQGNADPLIALLEDGKPYMLVAVFLMIVIVPPICEELLFRGLVLGNLLPYGRGVAIFGSALLFAAMHQNLSQFLYAAVAGVLLHFDEHQSARAFILRDDVDFKAPVECARPRVPLDDLEAFRFEPPRGDPLPPLASFHDRNAVHAPSSRVFHSRTSL